MITQLITDIFRKAKDIFRMCAAEITLLKAVKVFFYHKCSCQKTTRHIESLNDIIS